MPYTVGLYTLGCKVSQYETQAIAEAFERRGFLTADFGEVCDAYVINTCTVTKESDRKSRQMIRRAMRQNPHAVIAVTGCYAQTSPAEVAAIEGVCYVCGSRAKMRIPERVEEILSGTASYPLPLTEVESNEHHGYETMCITRAPRTRAYVKIQDGCECRCSYCAIPAARGLTCSRPPDEILRELEVLAEGGTVEAVLTGIETASYGADFEDLRLIDLLERIERESSIGRVRLGSLTPELMKPPFVSRMAGLSKLTHHFHLSMQSGSDSVLAGMKRRYNTAMALEALSRIREVWQDVQFTTDMMVGFPGETEAHFEETLAFVEQARFLDIHIFPYSPRKNTPAATYPHQVREAVKAQRSACLSAVKNRIRSEILQEVVALGQPLSVLLETREGSIWGGHSDTFIEVRAESDADLHGKIVSVLPRGARDGVLYGEIIAHGVRIEADQRERNIVGD